MTTVHVIRCLYIFTDYQGWIRHAKTFCPGCIVREDMRCDMDENLPNAEDRIDCYISICCSPVHVCIMNIYIFDIALLKLLLL